MLKIYIGRKKQSLLEIVLPYSFVLGFFFLIWFYINLAEIMIMNLYTIILLIISVFIYFVSKKTLFFAIYFNYLLFWVCFGNINFIIYSLIWKNWGGDIIRQNYIYGWFILVFTICGCLFNRQVRGIAPTPISRYKINRSLFIWIFFIFTIIFSYVFMSSLNWGGLYFGGLTDETRFSVKYPSIINRLTLSFPILGMLLLNKFYQYKKGFVILLLFIIFSFIILTSGGSRFHFFQMMSSLIFFTLFTGNLKILKRYKVPTILIMGLLILSQPMIAIIRSGGNLSELKYGLISIGSFFSSWGGEYRDGAASLVRFDYDDIKSISDNYLATLIVPIIPRQITGALNINKNYIFTLSASFIMQEKYGIEFGSIRIGGVMEAYYWLGFFGVTLVGLANYIIVHIIDIVVYKRNKTFSSAAITTYLATSMLYFIPSQSCSLLAPFFAFLSIYILAILIQILLKENVPKKSIKIA